MVRQCPAALCPARPVMCVTTAAQPQKVSQLLAGRNSACQRLFQGYRNYGPRAQNGTRDSLLSQIFFLFLSPNQRLYILNIMSTYTVYTHIWQRIETVNELPLPPNTKKTGSRAKCLLDIYHWGAGLAVTGRICDIRQNVLQSSFQTGSSSSPSYFQTFLLIAFL